MNGKNVEYLSPSYQCSTPVNKTIFNFPSNANIVVSSVDRMKNVPNYSVLIRSRRSFTPMRNSFLLRSPDISPIAIVSESFLGNGANMNIVRLPPEKISKAAADSTSTNNSDFVMDTIKRNKTILLTTNKTNRDSLYSTPQRTQNRRVAFHAFDEIRYIPPNPPKRHLPKLNEAFVEPLEESKDDSHLNHRLNVSSILFNSGLKKYVPLFLKEGIGFPIFLNFEDADLIKIGINISTDRQDILSIIDELNKI